jgi:hypothetical protein
VLLNVSVMSLTLDEGPEALFYASTFPNTRFFLFLVGSGANAQNPFCNGGYKPRRYRPTIHIRSLSLFVYFQSTSMMNIVRRPPTVELFLMATVIVGSDGVKVLTASN